jgi:uncharacterized peroxidase-related enzyme
MLAREVNYMFQCDPGMAGEQLAKEKVMYRFKTVSPESATGKAKELLDAVNGKLGFVPNMMRAMANSPAVLEGYLNLSTALGKGELSAKLREQIALAISQKNQCDYCVAAHSAIGKVVGLTAEQIEDGRQGTAVDSKTETLIRFALKLVQNRGKVAVSDIVEIREAGFNKGAIAEVIAHVALNVFTNYFNQVAGTVIDFPAVPSIR